jgi:hypothetical protein
MVDTNVAPEWASMIGRRPHLCTVPLLVRKVNVCSACHHVLNENVRLIVRTSELKSWSVASWRQVGRFDLLVVWPTRCSVPCFASLLADSKLHQTTNYLPDKCDDLESWFLEPGSRKVNHLFAKDSWKRHHESMISQGLYIWSLRIRVDWGYTWPI